MSEKITRRGFLSRSSATAVAGGVLMAGSARSASAAPGANDQVRIGLIGCGVRNMWLAQNWLPDAAKQYNATVVACCDIWKPKRENGGVTIKKVYGTDPTIHNDYRKLLDDPSIHAVFIATPDHQHCTQLMHAVEAGKDVYCEKPFAMNMTELNAAYDAIKKTSSVVTFGTHGRSCHGAQSAKDFYASGKLGKLFRVEESRSLYPPYWNFYTNPDVLSQMKESDTDWKAFVFNRPMRPFIADQHLAWMGYRDFSIGPVGGWMSHMSDLVQFVTDCNCPVSAVTHGTIVAPTSQPGRDCPDNITALVEYGEGFVTEFTTHFGNGSNDYMTFYGEKGVMKTDAPDGWPNGIRPRVSGDGSEHEDRIKVPEGKVEIELENNQIEPHVNNWLRCIRERKTPAAHIDAAYKHGVAVVLADMAYAQGRKMVFDKQTRRVSPA